MRLVDCQHFSCLRALGWTAQQSGRMSFNKYPLQISNAFIPAGCYQGTHPKKHDDSFPPCSPSCTEQLSWSQTLTVVFVDMHGGTQMIDAYGKDPNKTKHIQTIQHISKSLCSMQFEKIWANTHTHTYTHHQSPSHNLTHHFISEWRQQCLFSSHHGGPMSAVHFPILHSFHNPGGGFEEAFIFLTKMASSQPKTGLRWRPWKWNSIFL